LAEVDLSKLHTRAEFVELIDKITIELYRKQDMNGFRLVQGTRGGAGYGAAGLDVMRAMVNNMNQVQIVDYPNSGSIADIPRDCVVQIPCLINAAGVWPLAMGEMERHMHALVNAAKQYEILTIEAAMEGDYRKALEALFASPLENSFKNSKAVLDELLLAHEDYLPNFKTAIAKIKNSERPY
ncbi:MAG: 6-phospho-beta-glucosidase, partial [Bacillota bacterium]